MMDMSIILDLLTPAMLFLIFWAILLSCRRSKGEQMVKGKMLGKKDRDRGGKPPELSDKQLKNLQENLENYIDLKFSRFKKEILRIIEQAVRNLPSPPEFEKDQAGAEGSTGTKPNLVIDSIEVEPDPAQSRIVSACVGIYNDAIKNPGDERRFRKEYRPERIDVPNAMERLRDPDLEPQFISADNGDLFVVELKDEDSTSYAVFPRFGLSVSRSNFDAGAIGLVFKCPGFKPKYTYRILGVKRPAYFQPGRSNSWDLVTQGELSIFSDEDENF